MSCIVNGRSLCTRIGDTVKAEVLHFDIDITEKLFFFESRFDFNNAEDVIKKELGDGMFISGENDLVFDAYLETRTKVGMHTAYLKCKDQDGYNTIFKWEIEVKPLKTFDDGNS